MGRCKMFVDKKFFNLIEKINSMDLYEIYTHIVKAFHSIPKSTQIGLEKYFSKYPFWGKCDINGYNYDIFYQKAKVLKEHTKDLVWLYDRLCDYKSKFTLYAIISNTLDFDFANLDKAKERIFHHYFDIDLLKECKDEVIVDIGAYNGDSVLEYVDTFGEDSYKRIYCYEITPAMIDIMKKSLCNLHNIEYRNFAVSDKEGSVYLQTNDFSMSANTTSSNGEDVVQSTTLDKDITEPISMVKMDIEGGEIPAIIGAREHIKADTPTLMIAVYHSNTDIFAIPQLIDKINNNYDFYLRYNGECIYPTEITLICLKKNR